MIQRSYLIWYKHKSYFHTHWQLFLLQIHPNIIVWYTLQMALFLFVVRTSLWYWHLVKTSRPKLEIFRICAFCWIFSKNYHHHFEVEFFQIAGIFPICFGCFLLTNTTREKFVELLKFYKAISLQYWQF